MGGVRQDHLISDDQRGPLVSELIDRIVHDSTLMDVDTRVHLIVFLIRNQLLCLLDRLLILEGYLNRFLPTDDIISYI